MFKSLLLTTLSLTFITSAHAEMLNAKQIRKLAPGSYDVTLMDTYSITVKMLPGGKIFGTAGDEKDNGRWTVAGNKLCIKWSTWLESKARCSTLEKGSGELQGNGFTFRKI